MALPSTMRAAQWSSSTGGFEKHFTVKDIPLPKKASSLPKDTALVKVAYSSVNPVDYKLAEIPFVGGLFNRTPGCDFAGTVVSTTLPDLKAGQKVCGQIPPPTFGACAEYVTVAGRDFVAPVPSSVQLKDAAGLGVAAVTAYHSIVPFVSKGDHVFINGGSGGVGTYGIQIAKAIGCSVTATCSGPNVELCKSLGADEVIDYRTTNVVEHLKRQGTQYTVLFDTVNTPEIYFAAHHYLKPKGVFVAIAGSPSLSAIISFMQMFLLPQFLGGGQRTAKFVTGTGDAAAYRTILGWMAEGKLKTQIEQEYQLNQVGEAFTKLKSGRTRGKIIIQVAGE